MAFQQSFDPPSGLLTSFTGGNSMLEVTTSDTSYGSSTAAADGTHKYQAPSSSTSTSEAVGSAFQYSLHLRKDARSPQSAFDYCFSSVPSPVDTSSDWPRQQSNATNNDDLAFSSPRQGSSFGRGHQPLLEIEAGTLALSGPPQAHESVYSRGLLAEPFSLLRSSQPFVIDGLSTIPVTQPSFPPGHLLAVSQTSPSAYSSHSSQDGTPSITISNPGDEQDALSGIPMLNNPGSAQGGFFKNSARLIRDSKSQAGVQTIGGSASPFRSGSWPLSPSVEPNAGYPPSEADSITPSQGKSESKCLRAASMASPCRPSDSYYTPFGSPGSHSQDRPRGADSSGRRVSTGKVPLLPRPPPHGVVDRDGMSTTNRQPFPRKSRGKRNGPMREDRRKLATKRRNERTVCIGCKMAKVMCNGRADGRDCARCASSHSNAPKPFVCAPASFFELVQQGSTVLLALHNIYPFASTGWRQQVELPSEISIRYMLSFIDELQKSHDAIRVYGRKGVLYELDLHACWVYINSICSPTVHPFRQFIDRLRVQRQDTWKTCIRDGHGQPLNEENLCDTLLALDDMAPWVTYTLTAKTGSSHGRTNELQTTLAPDNGFERQIIIISAQLSRIIGRKLELQFYDHLKKALANPSICRELVLDVGRTLMSLRRRLWTYSWAGVSFPAISEHESHDDDDEPKGSDLIANSISRLKQLCQVLYVYFCYMRRRLSPGEQEGIRTMMVLYPDGVEEVEESFPQYESLDGFEEWLLFKDQPMAEAS